MMIMLRSIPELFPVLFASQSADCSESQKDIERQVRGDCGELELIKNERNKTLISIIGSQSDWSVRSFFTVTVALPLFVKIISESGLTNSVAK